MVSVQEATGMVLRSWRHQAPDAQPVPFRERVGQAFVEEWIGDQVDPLLVDDLCSQVLAADHAGRNEPEVTSRVGKIKQNNGNSLDPG